VIDEVTVAISAVTAAEGRLEAGLRAFVAATLADERTTRVNLELLGLSAELEELRARATRDYVTAIAVAVEGPAWSADGAADGRLVAVALVGAARGLILDWLSGDRSRPASTIVDALLAIFGPRRG
jgi:hypothetical protein